MRFLIPALLLLASAPAPGEQLYPAPSKPPPPKPPRRGSGGEYRDPVLAIACPKCGAEPGKPCPRQELGRYPYHRARVEAVGKKP